MDAHWYGVDLEKHKVEAFRGYLIDHDIPFEPSENYNLIHFQVKLDPGQVSGVNAFLANLS